LLGLAKRVWTALLLAPVLLVAASAPAQGQGYAYTLVDPGTFGGPQSFLNLPAVPLTPQGALLGTADTATADEDYPNFNPFMVGFADPYIVHAFAWRDDRLTDLGALPGNNSSAVFEINGTRIGVGMSETSITDPYTGWPSAHAVMYVRGKVKDLGTLPGGFESQANDINNRGLVSGFASNGIQDPYSMLGWGTQARSFVWRNGVMTDIGTLGGPDAVSTTLNARGEITGQSYTDSTANPATGVPTTDPFLWHNGRMRDLGTLGGAFGLANWLNDRGEVVGQSDLAGDQASHPFLWDGKRMLDLGTLGGDFGAANDVNDAGAVVGWATTPGDSTAHAFLWDHGVMTDLTGANSTKCTIAGSINQQDDAVGITCDEQDALLWANGKQYDLNTLIAPSQLRLTVANYIDNRGDIVGHGVLPDGSQRVFLLIRNPSMPLPQSSTPAQPAPSTDPGDARATMRLLATLATHQGGVAAIVERRLLLHRMH
jgi:probable HAF family extracellular repeat protein